MSAARKLPIDRLPRRQFTVLLTKSGRINIQGPDGQTVIDQGVIDTNEIVAGGTVFIGNQLSSYESGSSRILIGNANDESLPYVRAQYNSSNYVQMVGVSGSSGEFLRINASGEKVFTADSDGIKVHASSSVSSLRSMQIRNSSGNLVGYYGGNNNSLHIASVGSNGLSLFGNDDITIESAGLTDISSGDDLDISASGDLTLDAVLGNIRIFTLPTSDPGVGGALWRSGNDLKIST